MALSHPPPWSPILDDALFEHSARVMGKVVLITGAANAIGRETAIRFAFYGAKLVIGDQDAFAASEIAREIQLVVGGTAVWARCDVTIWDNVLELFELAVREYGVVDIVVANANVTEVGRFTNIRLDDHARPLPPQLTTVDINLVGALYTTHLAQHYLSISRSTADLKSLVLLGSVASWQALPRACLYTATKHAVLGLMRSIYPVFSDLNIRIAVLHPFFAETDLLYPHIESLPFELPLSPITRVAGAIFYTATNPDSETSGASWIVLDDGPLYAVPKEELKVGVYDKLNHLMNPSRNHPSDPKPKTRWRFLRTSLPYIRPALLSLALALIVWRKFRSFVSLRLPGG
ncbi:NAD(P)-binding protein [Hymenopellis radicata]|nr:NAD(P)-binding protein [Hymenopellis radicata]